MATITPQQADGKGTDPSLQSANAGGDSIEVKKGHHAVYVILENTSGSQETVTLTSQASNLSPGATKQDLSVSVDPNSIKVVMVPKDETSYLRDSNGQAQLSYSSAAAFNIGAVMRLN